MADLEKAVERSAARLGRGNASHTETTGAEAKTVERSTTNLMEHVASIEAANAALQQERDGLQVRVKNLEEKNMRLKRELTFLRGKSDVEVPAENLAHRAPNVKPSTVRAESDPSDSASDSADDEERRRRHNEINNIAGALKSRKSEEREALTSGIAAAKTTLGSALGENPESRTVEEKRMMFDSQFRSKKEQSK